MTSAKLPLLSITVRVVQPPASTCHTWTPICWSDAHPGAAGYLQAIGALLLLGAAIYQSLSDHRRKLAEIRTFVDLCREAMNDVRRVLEPFIRWATDDGQWDSQFAQLEIFYGSSAHDTLLRILDIPLTQWPDLTLYKRMRSIQHELDATRRVIDAYIRADGAILPTKEASEQAAAILARFVAFNQTTDKVARRPLRRLLNFGKSSIVGTRHFMSRPRN